MLFPFYEDTHTHTHVEFLDVIFYTLEPYSQSTRRSALLSDAID